MFAVPLAHVLDPRQLPDPVAASGAARGGTIYAVPYGPYYIWGATARCCGGWPSGCAMKLARRLADGPRRKRVLARFWPPGHRALFVGGACATR